MRFEITGELATASPLHVGSGRMGQKTRVGGKQGEPPPEVAELVRDVWRRPYLPGTSLKGLLRRIGEGMLDQSSCEALFGARRDELTGAIGALTVRGAAEIAQGSAQGMPYAEDGVFVSARTRVDRHSGTADDNSLHFAEMVAPAARFRLRLLLEPPALYDREGLLKELIKVLSALSEPEGVAIGRGQADGFGRIMLDPSKVTISCHTLDHTGNFATQNATALWQKHRIPARPPAPDRVSLTMICEGPFAVLDSSHVPQRDQAGNPQGPQLKAQARGGKALLLGSSLSGALRSRAAWLESLRRHRGGIPVADSREVDNPGRVLSAHEDPSTLTAVERLFGVTGFRGLIEIVALEVTRGSGAGFNSVKLDRYSGAPVDNALFKTATFVGTEVGATLALSGRQNQPARQPERDLFEALIDHIVQNGIVLGHGGGKGFGWFSVKRG